MERRGGRKRWREEVEGRDGGGKKGWKEADLNSRSWRGHVVRGNVACPDRGTARERPTFLQQCDSHMIRVGHVIRIDACDSSYDSEATLFDIPA